MIFEHTTKYRKTLVMISTLLLLGGIIYLAAGKVNSWFNKKGEQKEVNGLVGTFGNNQIEKAITDYLTTQEHFSWKTRDDSYQFCSIENLDPEQNLFPLYVWVYCAEYGVEGGELITLSGSSGPAKINYPNELSYYDLRKFSYEAPGDGSAYSIDIRRIFPEELHSLIFGYDKDTLIQRNRTLALANHRSWEEITQLVGSCEVKHVFQAHSRAVSVELKNGIKLSAIEPQIDDLMKIVVTAEPKCGRIIMATE